MLVTREVAPLRRDHPERLLFVELETQGARGDPYFVGNFEDGLETYTLLSNVTLLRTFHFLGAVAGVTDGLHVLLSESNLVAPYPQLPVRAIDNCEVGKDICVILVVVGILDKLQNEVRWRTVQLL